jgi:hypothetical protein
MLDFLKRLFSAHKPAEKTPEVPFQVETPKVVETTPLIISARPGETAKVEEKPVVEEVPVQAAKPKARKAPVRRAKPATAKPATAKEPKLKRTK